MKCVSLPRNFSFFCQLSSEVEWLFFEPSVIKTAVKKILDVGFLRVLGGTSRYLRGPIVLKGNQSEHAIHSLDLANSRKQVLGEVCLVYDANICKVEGLLVP